MATAVKQILQKNKELQDIIAILGVDELSEEDKITVVARAPHPAVPHAEHLHGQEVHRRRGLDGPDQGDDRDRSTRSSSGDFDHVAGAGLLQRRRHLRRRREVGAASRRRTADMPLNVSLVSADAGGLVGRGVAHRRRQDRRAARSASWRVTSRCSAILADGRGAHHRRLSGTKIVAQRAGRLRVDGRETTVTIVAGNACS